MLFVNAAVALVSVATVASALTVPVAAGPVDKQLLRRKLSAAQKEAAKLKSLSKALASQSKLQAKKAKSIAKASKAIASKSKQVASASKKVSSQASAAKKSESIASKSIASAKSSAAASQSSAKASLSSAAASVSKAASSVSSASSVASSKASASSASASSASAAAAAASSSAAAASATKGCYPRSSFTALASESASGPSDCATFCGNTYGFIALSEPDSPPATCFCPDIDSFSDLKTTSTPAKCNAAYGSTDGTYVTILKV